MISKGLAGGPRELIFKILRQSSSLPPRSPRRAGEAPGPDEYAKAFLEAYLPAQTATVDVSCIQMPFLRASPRRTTSRRRGADGVVCR